MADKQEKPTLIVTGGAGFIGSHIAQELCSLGANVTVFDEAGRLMMTREYPVKDGQSEVYMDISGLKEGILTIVTESQGNRSAFRIIKQ